MIQYLNTVIILPSYALKELHLELLAGQAGKVIEIVKYNDMIKGCWVRFPHPLLGENEWFIPYSSIIC